MRIESGPTGERKVRTLLLFLMVAVFAIWFGYDGMWGYPGKNRVELIETLPREQRDKAASAVIYQKVNSDALQLITNAVQGTPDAKSTELKVLAESGPIAEKKQALASVLGGPPSFETDDSFYYFGPALGLKFMSSGGELKLTRLGTQKTEMDIKAQKALAICLAFGAIYAGIFHIRVRKTHALLDDSGLTYNGRGPIHWVSMKELDTTRFADKGWIHLIWDDHGTQKRLKLDEYHLARFNEIIDAICEKKGFENPLVKPQEDVTPSSTPADV